MGFWEAKKGIDLGDGALDLTEEFLKKFSKIYINELNRRPNIEELCETLRTILYRRSDEFFEGCDELLLQDLVAKTKKRPRKQEFRPGDIVAIPLPSGCFAFARLSPQAGFLEYYRFKSKNIPFLSVFSSRSDVFRLPFTIDEDAIEDWRWRVIGNLPYSLAEYKFQHFLVGRSLSCDESTVDNHGFILVDSALREATKEEREIYPKLKIASEASVVEKLVKELEKAEEV